MDKILSARIDESIVELLDALSRSLHKTKKKILEEALDQYAKSLDMNPDVFEETHGTWRRNESPDETRRRIRDEFERSMRRRHQ